MVICISVIFHISFYCQIQMAGHISLLAQITGAILNQILNCSTHKNDLTKTAVTLPQHYLPAVFVEVYSPHPIPTSLSFTPQKWDTTITPVNRTNNRTDKQNY